MGIPFSHTENQSSWRWLSWVAVSAILLAWLPGCAALGAVGAAAGAIDRVMDVAGVGKGRDAESNKPIEVAMKIHAGERLNASGSGQPLSLVLRVYSLRSAERLKALAYARLSAPEGEREALGEDLVAVRELVLIPGKSYTLNLKMPGEASTIGATPAVQNAVIDALSHLGVRHLDMPCTSQRVWQAIVDAEAGTLPDPWREPPAVFARLAAGQEVDAAGLQAAEGI